ncbi:MAG: hypothetical protein EA424_22325 [Planctomycetaceae bacterium]|nr:MAG: hypothetical protein EA424_22325 [Planctomycetaceae bacterium]
MSTIDPFQLSFETVVAASPMLGHRLENRASIRQRQDASMLEAWQESSTLPLRSAAQQDAFVVAPLDVLVSREDGRAQFHIIELNGTGIGGVSNMPKSVVTAVAASLRRVARSSWTPDSVLLLPVSGKECNESPRLNKLMHEKLIFAEAMQSGLADAGGQADIVTLAGLDNGNQTFREGASAVVIGYIKDLLDACEVGVDGRVYLHGRQVSGAVNDRFCLNLISKFKGKIDMKQFTPINGTYLAGGDKGAAYSLLDEHLVHQPSGSFPSRVNYAHATNRAELISTVLRWLRLGRRPVIKPHGTGIGHGIEFFLDRNESEASVIRRIDESLRVTEEYYAAVGGALPYTICEFIDSDVIEAPEHRLEGHKYELRIVVYRDGLSLKACPTIAKVASTRFDAEHAGRENLINNITNSSVTTKSDGTEYMLPLCCEETLRILGISNSEMDELCRVATQYVRHAIDEIPRMESRMDGGHRADWSDVPAPVRQRMVSLNAA